MMTAKKSCRMFNTEILLLWDNGGKPALLLQLQFRAFCHALYTQVIQQACLSHAWPVIRFR